MTGVASGTHGPRPVEQHEFITVGCSTADETHTDSHDSLKNSSDERYKVGVTAAIKAVATPPPGTVHLWRATAADDQMLDARVLSPQERKRLRRRTGSAAESFRRAHVALRHVVAAYQGRRSEAAQLETQYGGPPRASGVRLSLARSEKLAIIAVAATSVGVDVEPRMAADVGPSDLEDLAAATLTPLESALLNLTPRAQRPSLWLRQWLRKEAALKACGARLGEIPLFELEVSGPRLGNLAFADLAVDDTHAGAIALPADSINVEWKELGDVLQ